MKTLRLYLVLAAMLALVFVPALSATTDVAHAVVKTVHFARMHPFTRGAVLASGECAAGIAFSSNPVGAASVGLPVLLVGNLTALWMRPGELRRPAYLPNEDVLSIVRNVRRFGQRHPFIGQEVQNMAGTFCLSYGLTRPGRHAAVKPSATAPKDPKTASDPPPPAPKCSGNACAGGGPQPPSGSNPPPGGNNPPPPPGGNGNGCIQDCGIPGNGGVNGGHDINKPPFPGVGSSVPGSH